MYRPVLTPSDRAVLGVGLRAARLLILWVRIPLGTWMSVCCKCCVLSGRGPCDELITRPEESYRLWCVFVCDLETSWMGRLWPTWGLLRQKKKNQSLTEHNDVWRHKDYHSKQGESEG